MGNERVVSRRAFLGGSAGVAMAAALAACSSGGGGGSTSSSNGKVTLNIMDDWAASDPNGGPLNAVLSAFHTANPNITIAQTVYTDAEVPQKVNTLFLAKQEPDIIFNNYWAPNSKWLDQGVALPVNDLLSQWGLRSSFLPAALQSLTQADGKIVAFPLEGFNWPMWYNTDILSKVGASVPTTTDELIATAAKLAAAGYVCLAAPGAEGPGRALFRLILHSAMSDDDVAQTFANGGFSANANAQKGVELFVQLRDAGVFSPGAAGLKVAAANQQYFSGKAAMLFDGSWDYTVPKGTVAANTKLGGFPLPAGSPHQSPIYYVDYSAKGIWITPNGAKKMDAVKTFVQYFFQPDNITPFVTKAAMVPPLTTVHVDPSAINPIFAQSLTDLANGNSVAKFWGLYPPAAADSETLNVTKLAYVKGTTAAQILAKLDAAYGN